MVNNYRDMPENIPEYYYYPANIQMYLSQIEGMSNNISYPPAFDQQMFLQSSTPWMSRQEINPTEQRIIQQFLDDNGQVDIQKMLKTIGQFADTVQQVSPVVKQINDLIKSFRTT